MELPDRPARALPAAAGRAIVGIDFTSAPSRRKPITLASGRLVRSAEDDEVLALERIDGFDTWACFEGWLARGCWIAAMDFPFGLPRDFVAALG
jgi:hypothetical protein